MQNNDFFVLYFATEIFTEKMLILRLYTELTTLSTDFINIY